MCSCITKLEMFGEPEVAPSSLWWGKNDPPEMTTHDEKHSGAGLEPMGAMSVHFTIHLAR
jgi:hypothetical protein